MQASQALQRVLSAAHQVMGEIAVLDGETGTPPEAQAEQALDQEAWELCNKILTVAVPLARFRCFVTIEKVGPKTKLGLGDFTVSGLDISAIKNGLVGLSMEPLSVYVQLWEHREEGKFDMLSGYQGQTKTLGFRSWLRDIDRHNEFKPTNSIELPDVPSA